MTATTVQRYNLAARIFHWLGALFILAAWLLVEQGEAYLDLHKAVGFSFFVWTVLRIINRLVTRAPAYPPMPAWQTKLASLTHLALYVFMLGMPMTGMMASLFGGFGVDVFGLFTIPGFDNVNRDLARTLMGLHENVMFNGLIVLIVAHIAAALYHQFIMKDNLLARMK